MRIVEVIKGSSKGKFLIQKQTQKGDWKTIKECDTKIGAELEYLNRACPFKDNRIVDDITFAVRFKHFLEGIQVCDACSEEELEYLKYVADKLLQYQIDTVTPNSAEEQYLKNLKTL